MTLDLDLGVQMSSWCALGVGLLVQGGLKVPLGADLGSKGVPKCLLSLIWGFKVGSRGSECVLGVDLGGSRKPQSDP